MIQKMSCLDLTIVSKGLYKYVENLIIDKDLSFTPWRMDKKRVVYSDHFSCLLTLKNIPIRVGTNGNAPPKTIRWNLKKKGGWDEYLRLTTNNNKLDELVNDDAIDDPETIQRIITKESNKVKFKVFGKVGIKKKGKASEELVSLQRKLVNFNKK